MKTRNGFVSNSSSSSFVVVGTQLTKKLEKTLKEKLGVKPEEDNDWQYEKEDELMKLGLELLYAGERDGSGYIVGVILADVSSDGDYMEGKSYSMGDLSKMSDKIRKVLGEEANVKLMMGTRPS